MGLSKEQILTELVAPAIPHHSESQSRIVRNLSRVIRPPPDKYQLELFQIVGNL